MGLSDEETEEIKQKLISHIESTFPEEQKSSARQQIELMDSEQLENFLKKNQIIKDDGNSKNECVFCSIASDKIRSCKIDENEKAIAVLDINPISKGHSLVIPREHTDNAQKEVLALAKKVSENIKKKLKPKKVEISKSELFGHEIINLLPVYDNEDFNSKRNSAKMEELEIVKEELEKKKSREKISKPKTKKINEFLWLPKRIP